MSVSLVPATTPGIFEPQDAESARSGDGQVRSRDLCSIASRIPDTEVDDDQASYQVPPPHDFLDRYPSREAALTNQQVRRLSARGCGYDPAMSLTAQDQALLGIYLNDHLAGAVAGSNLARRLGPRCWPPNRRERTRGIGSGLVNLGRAPVR